MNKNSYGEVTITEQEALSALYNNSIVNLDTVYIEDTDVIEKFNNARNINADKFNNLTKLVEHSISVSNWDTENQKQWFMPDNYYPNLIEYLYECCTTNEQKNRVTQELELFIQHHMMDLLFYLKYLVDTMRNNNILWGVGWGSCVRSYILFLIGVHKIDSLRYNLDITEFLKQGEI